MENKYIIIAVAVIAIVAVVLGLMFFSSDSYKNVDDDYVDNPVAGENVRLTASYFGKTGVGSENDLPSDVNVMRIGIGNKFVFIKGNFSELDGMQGNDFKLEGKFNVDGGVQKGVVNGLSVTGYEFIADKISAA